MGEFLIARVLNDLIVLLVMLVSWLLLKLVAKTNQFGFFCEDYSISMPFKQSTISNQNLMIMSILLPILVVILTEAIRFAYHKHCKQPQMTFRVKMIFIKTNKRNGDRKEMIISELVRNLYIYLSTFLLGLIAAYWFQQLGKKTIGRLRPNFLDVCKPNVNPYTLCANHTRTYLTPNVDFTCTTADQKAVGDSMLSFPSGHANLSFYAMTFLALFVYRAWSAKLLGFFVQLAQIAFISAASFTALSRVIDHKHHPTDVLAGSLLGISLASIAHFYLRKSLIFTSQPQDRETNEIYYGLTDASRANANANDDANTKSRDAISTSTFNMKKNDGDEI